ncbi:hypothetical protein BLNAU_17386 [Blattamonas nauphoetae]|uniref:Uncharacterized protein n=1 Tax=Blattamonas nauphoetae TaxID=2049346 RepID=A0ABQ9X7C8_9EUKA|nr:hypothetical protein BLNAU_17386 [Blattamonas nauphoetae]
MDELVDTKTSTVGSQIHDWHRENATPANKAETRQLANHVCTSLCLPAGHIKKRPKGMNPIFSTPSSRTDPAPFPHRISFNRIFPNRTREICRNHSSQSTCLESPTSLMHLQDFSVIPEQLQFFHIIFSDLLVPLEGFLRFICRHYSIFDIHNPTSSIMTLLLEPMRCALFYEEIHSFMLPPLSVAIINCFIHFTTVEMIDQGLSYLRWTLLMWKDAKPEVQRRSKDIMASLREEGLDDSLELETTFSFLHTKPQRIYFGSLDVMTWLDSKSSPTPVLHKSSKKGQDAQRKTLPEQKATARFSAEQDSQMMTSFEAEQNAEEERGWDTNQKKGNGPRRQIHPIRSEKQSEMALLPRSHSLPFATDVVGVIFFTLAECTLSCYGEEGGGCGRVVGSETNFGAGFECRGERIPFPRENRCIVTRTGLGGSFKFAWSFGGERGVCGVGEKSGRKCWSVYNESGVGFSSITDSLSSFVAHVGESTRDEEASESSDAADETCESVGGRACRSGVVPGRSLPSEGNRRMPQQLCGHILNINLRHVQSEWSVGSASAGQRRATRERSGLVFANFSGIRCLLASPDCRIDPAGSVPLVGSLVCGRFVDELDFGFTTHGASEQGNFTFGAVRTLGAD